MTQSLPCPVTHQIDIKVFLSRWSLNGHLLVSATVEDFVHSLFRSPEKQSSVSRYDSFTQKMVFEWTFISNIVEDSAYLLFRSPGRQKSLS